MSKQESLGWGKSIVETLSNDMQKEFPGMHGFSARNLWNMRIFYLTYRDNSKLQPLVAEISWTMVEYALKDTKKPIGVSTYKLTERLPYNLKKYLPSPEEMIKKINSLK